MARRARLIRATSPNGTAPPIKVDDHKDPPVDLRTILDRLESQHQIGLATPDSSSCLL